MKVSVIVFPGSNCDHDAQYVYQNLLKCEVSLVWHRDRDLKDADIVVIPGGFSYGDYLRTGAMARLSPAMQEVKSFSEKGGKVIGICNGFQILCEAGLLPGALLRNSSRKFISKFVSLKVENTTSSFTKLYSKGDIITCPVAHGEGSYYADQDTLTSLEDNGQVVFRYIQNPNGSAHDIAGICNKLGNVVGLMPHPERASEQLVGALGSTTGLKVLQSAFI
jgi:phosphoribosylformylglycinamidine synthase I